MKYIKNVETLEELKKAYKKLALKLHPDCGGNEEEMKILNNEYDELFSKLKNTHKNKEGETYTKETTETPEQFKDIINKLFNLKMDGVAIEVVGTFIWLTGNTKPFKDDIKALEFRYSPKNTHGIKHQAIIKNVVEKIMIWTVLLQSLRLKNTISDQPSI